MGVDHFYLYDTGSDDETMKILAPWVKNGIVILHQFVESQGNLFQRSALRHCSTFYAEDSEWLIDSDVDEFWFTTRTLSSDPFINSDPTDEEVDLSNPPDRPLVELLAKNPLYGNAGGIVVSRQIFKNQGIKRLKEGESLLATQVLRDLRHVMGGEKFEWTKVRPSPPPFPPGGIGDSVE